VIEYRRISHGRRIFLRRVLAFGGGLAATRARLLAPVADDNAIVDRSVAFGGVDDVPLRGYLAQPARTGPVAGVVVVHDERGLLAPIQDVVRRLAMAGFAALAPDLLARTNAGVGVPELVDVPRQLRQADPRDHVEDTIAAGNFLRQQAGVMPQAHGVVGFGFGGDVTWRVAVSDPVVAATVAFDGAPPELEAVAHMKAAALGLYSTAMAGGSADLEAALAMAGVPHDLVTYTDMGDAWSRSLDWLRAYLPAADG